MSIVYIIKVFANTNFDDPLFCLTWMHSSFSLHISKKIIYIAFIFPLFYFFGIIQSTLSYNGGQ